MVKGRTTYLCYFSVHEPLVQTQVLPYLRVLVGAGFTVELLTFEPSPEPDPAAMRERLRADGIDWHSRRYHKRPTVPATLLDVAVGAWFVRRRCRDGAVDVLHARSHIPGLMVALGRGRRRPPAFLFDVRGFMAEEYVDAGVWPAGGVLFKALKRLERMLLRQADGLVVLTEQARAILSAAAPATPIEVIPCCVDLAVFPEPTVAVKEAAKEQLGLSGRRVVLYVGSTKGFYLFDEMVQFAVTAARADPSTFFLVLTQRDADSVAAQVAAGGLLPTQFSVRTVPPQEIARHALAADVALSFIPATYSKQASSPTKVAEYLACGVPVVATAGVGDIDSQLAGGGVGVLLPSLDADGYAQALDMLAPVLAAPDVARRCRLAAVRFFDLASVGGPRYVRLYEHLLDAPSPTSV
jgi:glycosyltransferase involved in cell wall biosynthesis